MPLDVQLHHHVFDTVSSCMAGSHAHIYCIFLVTAQSSYMSFLTPFHVTNRCPPSHF